MEAKKNTMGWVVKTISEPVRKLFGVLSAEVPDASDDLLMQDGWELSRFKQNPVGLLDHDHNKAIGTWTDLRVQFVGGTKARSICFRETRYR